MAKLTIPTFEQIATMITHLLHNFSELSRTYYRMFYSDTPENIPLTFYNENGETVSFEVPNRAKDFRYMQNGQGNPENNLAAEIGTVYQDTLNGKLYIKQIGTGNTGWVEIDSDSSIIKGSVAPEGAIAGSKGDIYEDVSTSSLYIKTTEGGNTGWILLNVNTENVVNRDLSNLSIAGEAHFANPSLDNLNLEGEAHFANPSLSNLNEDGNARFANPSLNNLNNEGNNKFANKSLANLDEGGEAHFANPSLDNLNLEGEAHFANSSLSNLNTEGEKRVNQNIPNSVTRGSLNSATNGLLDIMIGEETTTYTESGVAYYTYPLEYGAAGTWSFGIDGNAVSATANIILVGGGGGGSVTSYLGRYYYAAGGGAGGYTYLASVPLTPGATYTVTVGGGGGRASSGSTITAGSGGSSSVTGPGVSASAGGGGGGYTMVNGAAGAASGGAGGSGNVASGNVGGTGTGVTNYSAGVGNGGGSVYYGYGAGGSGWGNIAGYIDCSNGTPGYVRIDVTVGYSTSTPYTVPGSETVMWNVSPSNPLIICKPDKEEVTITGVNSDNLGELANGTYHKYADDLGDDLITESYVQYTEPSMPSNNAVWRKIGYPYEQFKYNSDTSSWEPYNKVYIGSFTVESGALAEHGKHEASLYMNDFNLTTNHADRARIANWAMPSGTRELITLGASGASYPAAPANGYYCFETTANSTQNHYVYLKNETTATSVYAMGNAGIITSGIIPVRAGDIVSLTYANVTINYLVFIYAEGEV